MNCGVCCSKSKDLLYPVLPKKCIPGYLQQVTNNSKMAYKSNCPRLYVHMQCAMMVKGLKWMQERFTASRVDYVCFGYEAMEEMAKAEGDCQVCISQLQTKRTQQWRKFKPPIIKCEYQGCEAMLHPDCVIKRKIKMLWSQMAAKLFVFCPIHYMEMQNQFDPMNWDKFELVMQHIIQASMMSWDQEYSRLMKPLKEIEVEHGDEEPEIIEAPEEPEHFSLVYQTSMGIGAEYSKPQPRFQIDYQNKGFQKGNTSTVTYEQEPQPPMDQEEYYSNYFKKPEVSYVQYRPRRSEEKQRPDPSQQPSQQQSQHHYTKGELKYDDDALPPSPLIISQELPEDIDDAPPPTNYRQQRNPQTIVLHEERRTYLAMEVERSPMEYVRQPTEILKQQPKEAPRQMIEIEVKSQASRQSSMPPQTVMKVLPRSAPMHKDLEEHQESSSESELPEEEMPDEPRGQVRKRQQTLTVIALPQQQQEFWDLLDSGYFHQEMSDETMQILESQVGLIKTPPEDFIPSKMMSQSEVVGVIAQSKDRSENYYLQYQLIVLDASDEIKLEDTPQYEHLIEAIQLRDRKGAMVPIQLKSGLQSQAIMQLYSYTPLNEREFISTHFYQQHLHLLQSMSRRNELEEEFDFISKEHERLGEEINFLKQDLRTSIGNHRRRNIGITEKGAKFVDTLNWYKVFKCFNRGLADKVVPGKSRYYPNGVPRHKLTCKVCFNDSTQDFNTLLECKGCATIFHKWCYGFLDEDAEVLCDVCAFQKNHNIMLNKVCCFVCKQAYPHIPLKQLKGTFYHVSCLFLFNYVAIEAGNLTMKKGVNQSSMDKTITQWEQLRCCICEEQGGYKIRCTMCPSAAHATCAYLYGLHINLKESQQQISISFDCQEHIVERSSLARELFARRVQIDYLGAFSYRELLPYIKSVDDPASHRICRLINKDMA